MRSGAGHRFEFEDADALAEGAARLIGERLSEAIEARSEATLVLAGGSTPERAYRRLAAASVEWSRVRIFFGDERCVELGESGSNYEMARSSLLTPAGIRDEQVFRIQGEGGAEVAARQYEQTLRSAFRGVAWPVFDVVLLGLGDDGHTASIFPGDRLRSSVELDESWVSPADGPAPHPKRVTMTLGSLAAARHVLFLVSGGSKAKIVERVLTGAVEGLPAAQLARRAGNVSWLLDAQASSRLPR